MAGDFNLFFDSKLDVNNENPILKKKSLVNLLNLKKVLTYVIYGG